MTNTVRQTFRRLARREALLCVLLLTAGCATRVSSSSPVPTPEAANLPRPSRILVTDFVVDPGAVVQDQGVGPRLQRQLSGGSPMAAQDAIAGDVQSAISDTVVAALNRAGLPAAPAPAAPVYRPGDLILTGRVTRIDEGNRTRRLSIGFGAGKSIVQAVAELYAVVPGGPPVLLQTYDGSADSGRKPGMAVGASMAVANSAPAMGALSGITNISGERNRTPVGKEAASFGSRLASNIGQFAADRGWIPASSVPPWTR